MLKKTALHPEHLKLGARLVDFAGWDMPIQYQSQLDEHHAVRAGAGMFDVAHMAAVDLHGARTREFLRKLARQRRRQTKGCLARRSTPACCSEQAG